MTLTILDVEQGSDEWHTARRGILTASVIGKLLTPTLKVANNETSRAITLQLVAERISGNTDPTHTTADMERGIWDEPIARNLYSEHHAPVIECGFMVETFEGHKLGFSPDGLVGEDGLIEIKSRAQKKHLETILANEIPAENMAQLKTGILVSGRDWCEYVSYCSGMPLWRKRVHLEPEWRDAILAALDKFENDAAEIIASYTVLASDLPATERVTEVFEGMRF